MFEWAKNITFQQTNLSSDLSVKYKCFKWFVYMHNYHKTYIVMGSIIYNQQKTQAVPSICLSVHTSCCLLQLKNKFLGGVGQCGGWVGVCGGGVGRGGWVVVCVWVGGVWWVVCGGGGWGGMVGWVGGRVGGGWGWRGEGGLCVCDLKKSIVNYTHFGPPSPLQELEVGGCRTQYLLVYNISVTEVRDIRIGSWTGKGQVGQEGGREVSGDVTLVSVVLKVSGEVIGAWEVSSLGEGTGEVSGVSGEVSGKVSGEVVKWSSGEGVVKW